MSVTVNFHTHGKITIGDKKIFEVHYDTGSVSQLKMRKNRLRKVGGARSYPASSEPALPVMLLSNTWKHVVSRHSALILVGTSFLSCPFHLFHTH